MRLIKHPGRPLPPRRQIAAGRGAGEWRVTLAPGCSPTTALTAALAERGVAQAALQLLRGGFAALQVRLPEPGAGGPVTVPGVPRRLEAPAALIDGGGILGRDAAGAPRLRCRVLVADAAGRLQGGELVPEGAVVGAEGLVVLVAALAGAGFVEAADEETATTLFQPVDAEP